LCVITALHISETVIVLRDMHHNFTIVLIHCIIAVKLLWFVM